MTQSQLADQLSVSKQNISAWEKGRHQPSWSQILRIEQITGHSLIAQERAGSTWPFSQELLASLRALPPDQLRRIENQLRAGLDMPLLAQPTMPSGKPVAQAA